MEKLEFECKKEQMLFDLIFENKPNINYSIIKTALRKKDIKLNGKRITKNQLLRKNDIITLFLPEKKRKNVQIIYEDDKVIIAHKPSGMETTKKDKAYQNSDCLEDIFEGTYACHRLDKNTEGLLILAKSQKIANQMKEVFKLKKIEKTYQTIASGEVKDFDNLQDYLIKKDGKVQIFAKEVDNSKIIQTNYAKVAQKNDLFLLNVELLTGRTHQVRAHLAFHKIYVLGDNKYGNKDMNKKYHTKRQLLCATKIHFGKLPEIFENLSNKTFEVKPSFSLDKFE